MATLCALQLEEIGMTVINWDCYAPKKVWIFFWVLRHGRARTRALLHRHGALDAPDCPFCAGTSETEDYLFAACPRLIPFWARLLPGRAPPSSAREAVESVSGLLSGLPPAVAHTGALVVAWVLWKARNKKIFDNACQSTDEMVRHLLAHVALWHPALPVAWTSSSP
ncbi:uncharacterized protein [Setaria viridis]|uniref:uncharacterized protein n=1 Tax=Setaria viridis TaxID=4556 RepID=UPI003B3B009E